MPREQKIGSTLIILIVGFSMAYLFRKPTEKTAALPELADEMRINQQLSELRIRPLLPGIDLERSHAESPYENQELARELAGLKQQLQRHRFRDNEKTAPPPIGQLAPSEQLAERDNSLSQPPSHPADVPRRPQPIAIPPAIVIPPPTDTAPISTRRSDINPPQWTNQLHSTNLHPSPIIRDNVHIVSPGETLTGISLRYYGTVSRFQEIFEANRQVISSPNLLRPGMKLQIPGLVPGPLPEPEIREAATPEEAEFSRQENSTRGFHPFANGTVGPGLTITTDDLENTGNSDRRLRFVPARVNPFPSKVGEQMAQEQSLQNWR